MNENYHIGVAVDCRERVFVCEAGRVSIFTSEGKYIKSIAMLNGPFTKPRGVSVSGAGVVYVCDNNNVQASREFRGHLKESAGTLLSLLCVIFVAVLVIILYCLLIVK